MPTSDQGPPYEGPPPTLHSGPPRAGQAEISALTYKDAGVDIDAGDALVERIKPFARRTRIPEVLGDLGGFAGLCRVPSGIDEPVLVSGTDGVGTKLKLAFELDAHDDIGADLVGMCVNDIITSGARPLFFLDYFATASLSVDTGARVIAGIARACEVSGCALLGGETAELPGMYQPGEYDLAGFAVGVVARARIVDGTRTQAGDAVIALPSSGLHSNGYSLARRILERSHADLRAPVAQLGTSLGAALMTPTRLYARVIQALVDPKAGIDVRAMSHITGGGIPGNLPRVLPEGLGATLDFASFRRPPIFDLLARLGPVEELEMRTTFNLGIGFVIVVPQVGVQRAVDLLRENGEAPSVVGNIVEVPPATPFEARVKFVGGPLP